MFRPRAALLIGGLLCGIFPMTGCGTSGSTPVGPTPAPKQTATPAGPMPTPTQSALANDLQNPTEVRSVAGAANLTLTAMIDPATGGPTIMYDGAIGMPTIRVSPGDAINITYVDALPPSTSEPLNETNLHFHGLSVSPNAPGDDAIDVLAMPGQTLHYHIDIPVTHPPGTYWYHPHPHHESDWQVYNGISGAIIVDGLASISAATSGLPERVVILRNTSQTPSYSAFERARRKTVVAGRARSDMPYGGCSQSFGFGGEYTTINGRAAGGPIAMVAGQKQLWHVINASADGYYDLSIDGEQLHVVSIDGVALKQYPGASERDVSDIVIPPAGRADIVVTAPVASGAAFRTNCFSSGPDGYPDPPAVLGTIDLGTPSKLSTVPAPGSTPRALSFYDQPIGAPSVQRKLSFTEDGYGFYLNGSVYSPTEQPLFTAQSGTVEEWTLYNASGEVHAFHIHQVHFVTLDVDGVAQPANWNDTVNLPPQHDDGSPSISHVLIDFRDPLIKGIFLFHCHILEHEDGGMMHKIEVM